MSLANDITEAAAKALRAAGASHRAKTWAQLSPQQRGKYRYEARKTLAAALDTLAEYTARVAQDFEAQGLGYACERNLEPHEMREIAEAIRAEVAS